MNFTSTLDAATYDESAAFVRSAILEQDPTAIVSPGTAVDGLVIQNQARLAALHNSRLTQLSNATSLQAITEGLADVTDADVDNLVSNYFITRQAAVRAYGGVKIVVSADTSYVLPIGFQLSLGALGFSTTTISYVYPSSSSGVSVSSTTQIMKARPDGTFEFTIQVTAQQDGSASKLANGTVLTLVSTAAGMLSATVSGDFSGGTAAETNADLLARASTGITAKVIGGDEHIDALISSQYPTYTSNTVGVGSALMTRDQGNMFGISTGGKIDIYVKSAASMNSGTITVSATVTNASTKLITAIIQQPQASGIYRIVAIRPTGSAAIGGDSLTTITRSPVALAGFNPVLTATQDIAFSNRQSLTITWTDTLGTGAYTNGDTRSYDMDILYMPDLSGVDLYLTGSAVRPGGTDILVKAGVPCRVTVGVTLYTAPGYAQPTTSVVASAIANAINIVPFGTATLSGFALSAAIKEVAPYSAVNAISLGGVIHRLNETDLTIAPASSLTIPVDALVKQGPDNVFFSSDISDITVTLT